MELSELAKNMGSAIHFQNNFPCLHEEMARLIYEFISLKGALDDLKTLHEAGHKFFDEEEACRLNLQLYDHYSDHDVEDWRKGWENNVYIIIAKTTPIADVMKICIKVMNAKAERYAECQQQVEAAFAYTEEE